MKICHHVNTNILLYGKFNSSLIRKNDVIKLKAIDVFESEKINCVSWRKAVFNKKTKKQNLMIVLSQIDKFNTKEKTKKLNEHTGGGKTVNKLVN